MENPNNNISTGATVQFKRLSKIWRAGTVQRRDQNVRMNGSPGTSGSPSLTGKGNISDVHENSPSPSDGNSDLLSSSSIEDFDKHSGVYHTTVEIEGSLPENRHSHAAVLSQDYMFIFGGEKESQSFSDSFVFNFDSRSWSAIETSITPSSRSNHTAVLYEEEIYIFGGKSIEDKKIIIFSDLWKFNLASSQWSEVNVDGPKPCGRAGHTAVVHQHSMYIFGGTNENAVLNDLHKFNFATNDWTEIITVESPTERSYHSGALYNDSIYIYGGTNSNDEVCDDLWEFKIQGAPPAWKEVESNPRPPPLIGHTSVVLNNSIFLLGGDFDGEAVLYEFSFEHSKWFQIKPEGDPLPAYSFHSTTVRGDSLFIFGGNVMDPSNDLCYICLGKDEWIEESNVTDELSMQPQSEWEAIAMRRHPEILELRERIRPLTGATSYARMSKVARTESKSSLSYQIVLQLIMEHLEMENHSNTVKMIEVESNVKQLKEELIPPKESRLTTLLKLSQMRLRSHRVNSIFDSEIIKRFDDDYDKEVEQVDHLPGRKGDDEETDVFIWDEGEDHDGNIKYGINEKNQHIFIKSGTLNKLVEVLTTMSDKLIDPEFMKIFIYTYQSFSTPQMFLKKLIQRYQVPLPGSTANVNLDSFEELQQTIAKKVCYVIKFWIEKCADDFNERLLSQLNSFIDGPLSRDGHLTYVNQLRSTINKTIHNSTKKGAFSFVNQPPEPKVTVKILSDKSLTFADIDEEEIARQLTLMDFEIYSAIQPTEFLLKAWLDPHLKHKAPNIIKLNKRYQEISLWVATNVMMPIKAKYRAKIVERFIRIARALRNMANFQTLFAVIVGLTLPPVQKLSQTFATVPINSYTYLNELQRLIPRDDEDRLYRDAMNSTLAPAPVLPFLGSILQEILNIDRDEPDKHGHMINFDKRVKIYNVVKEVQAFQLRRYNLQAVHQVRTMLTGLDHKTEQELDSLRKTREN